MRNQNGNFLVGALFCVVACGPVVDPEAGANWPDAGPGQPDGQAPGQAPVPAPEQCNQMDIVFVIDDSGSMGEEQGNLATNFPQFARVLEEYRTESGELLDYRVAVTTTGRDLRYTIQGSPFAIRESGADGKFLQGCGMTRPWIERGDGNLESAFPCVAKVGTNGPSYEMPLMMVEWALGDRVSDGSNAGFVRDDALLAIVMLTDEDDCSHPSNDFVVPLFGDACADQDLIDVPHYLSFLDDLKDERGRWATAVIAGPTDCSSPLGDAAEAGRLKDFVAQTGDNAVFSSICEGDLSMALAQAIATFDAACQTFPPIE